MAYNGAQRHHCRDCGLFFDSVKSLDVHLHYHKENLLSKWAGGGGSDESNNNNNNKTGNHNNGRRTDAGSDAGDAASRSAVPSPYQSDSRGFSPGAGGGTFQFASSRTSPAASFLAASADAYPDASASYVMSAASDFAASPRFHPYQQYTAPERAAAVSSPQQCDKCGYVCDSGAALAEHLSVAHPPTPFAGPRGVFAGQQQQNQQQQQQRTGFASYDGVGMLQQHIKVEEDTSAEILDLDSHKVHVYQPPPDEDGCNGVPQAQPHPLGGMLWPCNSGRPFQHQHQLVVPGADYGRAALAPYHPQQQQQQQQQQHGYLSAQAQTQEPGVPHPHHVPNISSSLAPAPKGGSLTSAPGTATPTPTASSNQTWKSNEARRPKTYNCSACNKWFTSSGHLKRHYNTTLHKNAVKQSGVPDPAATPINNHHHPARDAHRALAAHMGDASPSMSSPVPSLVGEDSSRSDDNSHGALFGRATPHGLGLMPALGGSPQQVATDVPSGALMLGPPFGAHHHHTNSVHSSQFMLGAASQPQALLHQQAGVFPNGLPPHVTTSTTHQHQHQLISTSTSTNNCTGSSNSHLFANHQPLPSFAQFNQLYELAGTGGGSTGGGGGGGTNGYSVPEDVGGLSVIPDEHHVYALSPSNNNSYSIMDLEEDIQHMTSLEGDERLSPAQRSNNSSSSTPDCPTSTVGVPDMDKELRRPDEGGGGGGAVSSSTNVTVFKSSMISKGDIHKCLDCDKVFNKACYLTQHNKTFHSGDKPYKCNRCGKRFPQEYLYQEHWGKHAGDKPYKCDTCPKQFNHKTDLRRHMCLHTGEKPYTCDVCSKGFIRKDHMLKHCETHRKKAPHLPTLITM